MLLWEVDTDAADVVEVRDRRTYATASRVVTLAGDLPASPGEIDRLTVADDRLTVADDRLFLERVVVDVPGLGGGGL